jgi:serine/threonine-protein kinase
MPFGEELIGRVLGGRYRLVTPVGTGASATVYLAEDVQLKRRVAAKVLHPSLAADPTFLRRFRAEAQAAAALNHPNIVAVFDWGEDTGIPYLVTEYLGGGSLRAMLDRGRLLSPSQALMVGLEAARGLDFAHRRGLVHRDVKPANLLFGEDARLRIADFGLARAIAEAAWTEPDGVVLGTARYASPEQAKGQPVDGKTDVYSLALSLVEAVTGSVPFAADTTVATLMNRLDKRLPVSADLGPLAAVLERAGRPDPAERFDAGELGRALVGAAEKLPRPKPLPIVTTAVGEVSTFGAPASTVDEATLLAARRAAAGAAAAGPSGETAPGGAPRPATAPGGAAPGTPGSAAAGTPGGAAPAPVPAAGPATGAIPSSRTTPPAGSPGAMSPEPQAPRVIGEPILLGAAAAVAAGAGSPEAPGTPRVRDAGQGASAAEPPAPGIPGAAAVSVRPAAGAPATAPRPGAPAAAPPPPSAPSPGGADVPAAPPAGRASPAAPAEATAAVAAAAPGAPGLAATASAPAPPPAAPPGAAGPPVSDGRGSAAMPSPPPPGRDPTAAMPVVGAPPATPVPRVNPLTATAAPVSGSPEALGQPRRSIRVFIGLLAFLVLAALAAVAYVVWFRSSTPTYPVPNLVGEEEAKALNVIGPNGWSVDVRRERNDDQAAGLVFKTDPAFGSPDLGKGEPFLLYVSEGPTFSPVPELTGKSRAEVEALLAEQKLLLNVAGARFDEVVPLDGVLSWSVGGQTLPAGSEVVKGTTVDVVLSQGPEPRTVPNLAGQPFDAVKAALEQLGLVVNRLEDQFDDKVPAGNVIGTDPPADAKVDRGATVNVTVSKGPDVVVVPKLVGLTLPDAAAAIQNAGLTIGDVAGPAGGVVTATNVKEGETVRRGTAVNLLLV